MAIGGEKLVQPVQNLENQLYHYRAFCQSVTDGDTIKINWDLGRRTAAPKEIIRFSRVQIAELSDEKGEEAKWFVVERILNKNIIIKTELDKDALDKYGGFNRFLAEVYYQTPEGWINLNDELMEAGYGGLYKA